MEIMLSVPFREDRLGTDAKSAESLRQYFTPNIITNKNVLAWGGLYYKEDGMLFSYKNTLVLSGFNLILFENPQDIYGDWFIAVNTNPLKRPGKPEHRAFPYSISELEDGALKWVGSPGDSYSTQLHPFSLEQIIEVMIKYDDE